MISEDALHKTDGSSLVWCVFTGVCSRPFCAQKHNGQNLTGLTVALLNIVQEISHIFCISFTALESYAGDVLETLSSFVLKVLFEDQMEILFPYLITGVTRWNHCKTNTDMSQMFFCLEFFRFMPTFISHWSHKDQDKHLPNGKFPRVKPKCTVGK